MTDWTTFEPRRHYVERGSRADVAMLRALVAKFGGVPPSSSQVRWLWLSIGHADAVVAVIVQRGEAGLPIDPHTIHCELKRQCARRVTRGGR